MPTTPCPYCGALPASNSQTRCQSCNGLLEPIHSSGPAMVDPDLMKPVDTPSPQPTRNPNAPGHDHEPLAEELWHTAAAAPPRRRRRRRRKGPDPLVVGLAVLLLCMVGIGAVIVLTAGDGKDASDDPTADATQNNSDGTPPPQRTAQQVDSLRDLVVPRFEQVRSDGVPEPFDARFAQVRTLIEQARAYREAEQFGQAYEQYGLARESMGPLEEEIAQWRRDAEVRASIAELKEQVATLRDDAVEAEAQQWAAVAWNNAEFVWKKVEPMIASGDYEQADKALGEAQAMYQMSLGRAETAKSAAEARDQMLAAMKSNYSEQTLREKAPNLFEDFTRLRSEAERAFADNQFEDAGSAFAEATDALERAARAVELSRYARFYACDSGFKAAGVLLGVTSASTIESEPLAALRESLTRLGLSPNPAASLMAGEEPDYAKAAEALVTGARDAIRSAHGESVQACYLIGFHLRIIDQTLASTAYTDDQQKRVHQSLGLIEEQAQAAGWDIGQLNPAIEAVRSANRRAKTGSEPTETRQAWQRLLKPLTTREQAIRIMAPDQFPDTPDDPELFPGLGS